MLDESYRALAKVPAVTLGFWIIKILATTLGETGGDAVTMSMGTGYLVGTAIFMLLFIAAVAAQIGAQRFRPALYWLAIIASTGRGARRFPGQAAGPGRPGTQPLCRQPRWWR